VEDDIYLSRDVLAKTNAGIAAKANA